MLLEELSEEQKKAVTQSGNVLLTACPGSGKTRVIVYKLAYVLANRDIAAGENVEIEVWKQSSKMVLALTFTVRAAEEMSKRLEAMNIDTSRVWAGTIHAFCLKWIFEPYHHELSEFKETTDKNVKAKIEARQQSSEQNFKIADEDFCKELITKLKEKYRINPAESINLKFDRFGQPLEKASKFSDILNEYHKTLKQKKLIDFDLLLFYSYRILLQSKELTLKLAAMFELICVDEYQDTQDLQYAIISLLVKANPSKTSVFFVGDVDQAIYKSLGGIAKTHSEIRAELGGAPLKALNLSANYRSSQRIIDFYMNFQQQNIKIKGIGKYAKEKALVTLNRDIHYADIVPEIVRLIKLSLSKGIPENEICVLVPQWWLVTSISKQLMKLLPDCHFSNSITRKFASSIIVNTCMGVKGEEFETVIAYGLLRGYVPHWSAIISGDERETSQRLLYVIASRAKLNLHLIAERGRVTNNGKPYEINLELDEVGFAYDLV
ncbi:MAG: UvrD-helicase domain-containing protein [bacterium]